MPIRNSTFFQKFSDKQFWIEHWISRLKICSDFFRFVLQNNRSKVYYYVFATSSSSESITSVGFWTSLSCSLSSCCCCCGGCSSLGFAADTSLFIVVYIYADGFCCVLFFFQSHKCIKPNFVFDFYFIYQRFQSLTESKCRPYANVYWIKAYFPEKSHFLIQIS